MRSWPAANARRPFKALYQPESAYSKYYNNYVFIIFSNSYETCGRHVARAAAMVRDRKTTNDPPTGRHAVGTTRGGRAVLRRPRARNEWKFFSVLPQADRRLAWAWWTVLVLRGILPVVFVLLQVLTPLHQAVSTNLGDRPLPGSTTT